MSSVNDFPAAGTSFICVPSRFAVRWGLDPRARPRWLLSRVLRILRAAQRQARARRKHIECVIALGLVAAGVASVCYLTWQGLADRELQLTEPTRAVDVDLTGDLVETTNTRRGVLASELTTRTVRPPATTRTSTVSTPSSSVSGKLVAAGISAVVLLGGGVLVRRIVRRFRDLMAARADVPKADHPVVTDPVPVPDDATDPAAAASVIDNPEPSHAEERDVTPDEHGMDAGSPFVNPPLEGPFAFGDPVPDPIMEDAARTVIGPWLGLLDDRELGSACSATAPSSGGGPRVVLFERNDDSSTSEPESMMPFRSAALLRWG